MDEAASAGLAAHLGQRYGIEVRGVRELDVGVFRLERRDGPPWVARLFAGREPHEVQSEAAILRSLEAVGFPAERCADEQPVCEYNGHPVLITKWVEGVRADGRGRTFGVLGVLLGRLHARPAPSLPAGGAWHHLSPRGGPREEINAAIELLESVQGDVRPEHQDLLDEVLEALETLDDCHDLPHGFVHADFVPSNAITTPDDKRVIVDWAGAGRGPRLWSLAFLLWAGGVRDLRLANASITRYARHVTLEDTELQRLAAVIPARPLTMDVWSYAHGRLDLPTIVAHLKENRAAGVRISESVRAALLA